jgi:hypothetical protein
VFSQAAKAQKTKLENHHDLSGYFNGVPFKIFQPIDDFYHTTTLHFINEFNGTLKQMIDEFTSRLVTFFSKEMVASRDFESLQLQFKQKDGAVYSFVLAYLITRHIFTAQGVGFLLSSGAPIANPMNGRYYETTLITTLELLFMNHSGHTQTDSVRKSLVADKETHEMHRDSAVQAGDYKTAHLLTQKINKMALDITTPSEMIRQQNQLFGRQAEEIWNNGPFGSQTINPNYIPWGQTVYDAQDDSSGASNLPARSAQHGQAQHGPAQPGPAQHGPAQHGPAQHGPAGQTHRSPSALSSHSSSGPSMLPTPRSSASTTRPMMLSPSNSSLGHTTSTQSGGDVIHGNFVRTFVQKMTTPILSNNEKIATGGISVKNQLLLHNSQIFADITKAILPFIYHMILSVLLGKVKVPGIQSGQLKLVEGALTASRAPSSGKILSLVYLLLYCDPKVWKPFENPNGTQPSSLSSFFKTQASWGAAKMKSVMKHLSSSLNKAVHDSLEFQNGMSDTNELQVIVYENKDLPNVAPHYDIRVIGGPLTPSQFFSALSSSAMKVFGQPVSARLGVQGPTGWQVIEKGDPKAVPGGVHTPRHWAGPVVPTGPGPKRPGVSTKVKSALNRIAPKLRLPSGPDTGKLAQRAVKTLHTGDGAKRTGPVEYIHERASMDLQRHPVSLVERGREPLVPSTLASLLDQGCQSYFESSGDLTPATFLSISNLTDQGAALSPA